MALPRRADDGLDEVGLGVTADGLQLLNSRNCALNLSGYKYSFAVFA